MKEEKHQIEVDQRLDVTTNRKSFMMFDRRKGNKESMLLYLQKSGRKCANLDYYYGIAGIFGISLTDGIPFHSVQEFLFGVGISGMVGYNREGYSLYENWNLNGYIFRELLKNQADSMDLRYV
jgi:hypothetical protein